MTLRRILICLVLLASGTAFAGQLSPDLVQQLSATDSDQLVKVWIKLPESQQARAFASAMTPAATAVEKHRAALDVLKSSHAAAQVPVASRLAELERAGKAHNIRQHWLVNIVEAEISASELAALALRGDIEEIFPVPKIVPVKPVASDALSPQDPAAGYYTTNLKHIKADSAHTAGFTGAGRLICSFDTGIDGAHKALQNSWKGKGGTTADSLAAWYDPVYKLKVPHVIQGDIHGTHTMGLMVGKDLTNDTTYGVAPGAKWISAGVIDVPGASIIAAFEWAIDPDRDPNSIDDVPDVINHSWGYESSYLGCENVFYEMIDKAEAMGIVNILAAGNDGLSGASTVRNPANRANDSLDCFAVGMINSTSNPPAIDSRSSRGPSSCNGNIKPNVVAPGVSILSSTPGNKYNVMSGTSMAAPQVSGLVALLRQKKPSATVQEIKNAILTTTQTFGWSVPNNIYGWGEIDCMAALNALATGPATPAVRLYDFVHATIEPGDTVVGTVRVQNLGGAAAAVTGTITGSHPSLTILNGSVSFGGVAQNAIVNSSTQLRLKVSDTVSVGTVISLPFRIAGTGFQVNTSLAIVVEPLTARMIASHTGAIKFSLSNYGALGLGPGVFFPAGGYGFNFNNLGNDLLEGGIIVGTGLGSVVSGVHSYIYEPDMDFKVAPGGNMQFDSPYDYALQHSKSAFTDANADSPLGLHITQESYSFEVPDGDHLIIRYIVRNTSGATISGLRFGMYLDWDIVNNGRNAGGYDAAEQFAWMAYNSATSGDPNLSKYRGVKLLDGQLGTAMTGRESYINIPFWGGDGFSANEKWFALTNGMGTAETFKDSSTGLFQLLATGPVTLAAGQSDTFAFALLAGDSRAAIGDAALKSVGSYGLIAQLAPSQVSLIYPPDGNGSAVSDLLPTFQWTAAVDPNPGNTVTYTLQYGKDSLFTAPTSVPGLTTTSHTATDSLDDGARYWWRVIAIDNTGLSSTSDKKSFVTDISTDVPGEDNTLPKSFALFQNYPNPFNPSTTIAFDLPKASDYRLTVFDITGRVVFEENGHASPGRIEISWNAANAASGIYFYQVSTAEFSASRKMLLLK